MEARFVNIDTKATYPAEGGGIGGAIVAFENSGSKPLTDVDIHVEFNSDFEDFKIFDDSIQLPQPEIVFGKVKIIVESKFERIIRFKLFNPSEHIQYVATINRPAKIIAYSKVEGLTYNFSSAPKCY